MRGRKLLQNLAFNAQGKIWMDFWDTAAAAIKADTYGTASAAESGYRLSNTQTDGVAAVTGCHQR